MTPVGVESPVGTQKAGGFSALPSGADPRTERRTWDPRTGNLDAKMALVSGFLPVLAGRSGFFPGLGSLVLFFPVPVCFLFLLSPSVSRHWPRASRSSSQMGRDAGSTARAPTQETGAGRRPKNRLFQLSPLRTTLLCTSSRLSLFFHIHFAIYFFEVLVQPSLKSWIPSKYSPWFSCSYVVCLRAAGLPEGVLVETLVTATDIFVVSSSLFNRVLLRHYFWPVCNIQYNFQVPEDMFVFPVGKSVLMTASARQERCLPPAERVR